MGWTGYNANFYKKGKVDRLAEIKSLYDGEENYKILKASLVGSVVYAAIEKNTDDEKCVFAAVYLTSTKEDDYFNFSYKDLDETCGPNYYDCPESILKLLTPTDNDYAIEWRVECWENIRKKKEKRKNPDSLSNLPVGSIIEMKYWKEGVDTIMLEKVRAYGYKNPIWYNESTGYRYQNKTIEQQGYKVVKRATAL